MRRSSRPGRVAPRGRAVGADIDRTKLALAREEAGQQGAANVEFHEMENIADAVLQDGLATRDEIDRLVRELYDFAADPNTITGLPRVVQVWGRRPRSG
jgi:hypothetical protein